MPDRILTSHAGQPAAARGPDRAQRARAAGDFSNEAEYRRRLRAAVADVVARQRETGIDLVNDGEYGHSMGQRYDYGAWWTYVFQRLAGSSWPTCRSPRCRRPRPSRARSRSRRFDERRDWQQFADAYGDPTSGVRAAEPRRPIAPVCRGPITYTGRRRPARHRQPQGGAGRGRRRRRLPELGRARQLRAVRQRVLRRRRGAASTPAPTRCARSTRRSSTPAWSCSSTTRRSPRTGTRSTRSRASRTTGASPRSGSRRSTTPSRGLPAERIRFHLCWGSWHGPHTTDIPMADIVDLMLEINAGAYSFEAANVRHEHEWKVWQDVEAARRQGDPARASSATPPTSSSTPSSSPTASSGSPRRSAGRTSSPPPTAASAAASTRRSPGPSSRRSPQGAELATRQLWG